MGYVGIFINAAEIHARCKHSHQGTHWVRQLCYWSVNLKQRNSRKHTGKWCDQNLIRYNYHSVIMCLLSVSMFQAAAKAQGGTSSGSHSSEFDQCAWVKVTNSGRFGELETVGKTNWSSRLYACKQLRDVVGGNTGPKKDGSLFPSFSEYFSSFSG